MKYEFGIGSSKYKLDAKNDDIAFMTMVMFFQQPHLPIAIYKPNKKAITGMQILDMDNLDKFMSDNADDLKNAHDSIKKLTA